MTPGALTLSIARPLGAVVAEVARDIDTRATIVRLYLGADLTLTMPVELADLIGDALADADAVVSVEHVAGQAPAPW